MNFHFAMRRDVSRVAQVAIALLALMSAAALAATPIYRCLDRNLGVLYTDEPCRDGERMDIRAGDADLAAVARLERERDALDRSAAQRITDERRAALQRRYAVQPMYGPEETVAAYADASEYMPYGYGFVSPSSSARPRASGMRHDRRTEGQHVVPVPPHVLPPDVSAPVCRAVRALSGFALAAIVAGCATPPVTDRPAAAIVAQLAPAAKLRAAINFGNPVLAQKDPATGEPRGVSVDLSRELSRRLGVPLELVTYAAAGKVVENATTGAWDVAFVAIDPARAVDMDYTAAYVVIEGAYVVPQGSRIRSNEDVDRDGVRVVAAQGSAYDLYLARELKHAKIVHVATSQAVVERDPRRRRRRGGGREAAARSFGKGSPGRPHARRPVHGDQPGNGHAQGPPARRTLSRSVRRGDESVRIRRRRPRPKQC